MMGYYSAIRLFQVVGQWMHPIPPKQHAKGIQSLATSLPTDHYKFSTLLAGYNPTFKSHPLGTAAKATIKLTPEQQVCYYDGKLFGGYLMLLMDRILADCCQPAVTASFNTSFLHPVPPDAPIQLTAWPHQIERQKIFLSGAIHIPGKNGEMIKAVQAEALFIHRKGYPTDKRL